MWCRAGLKPRAGRPRGTAGSDPAFAFAAGQRDGGVPYYRIQAPGLLIEWQNSQRASGHAHTVIRNPGRDFTVPLA
jgi:hypothetical protein